MPASLATIDGVTMPLERATVGILDRGLLYGDSVFESLRTYGGRPFLLERHLERLERSAEIIGIDLGVPRGIIEREVLETLASSGNDESYVRVTVTRGGGAPGLGPWLAENPRRMVVAMPLAPARAETYEIGLRAVTFRSGRDAGVHPAAGAKTGNYLDGILALRAAHERGAAEALIVDARGRVTHGSSSNAFFVAGETILTAPLDTGILPGITRAMLVDIARARGIPVELRAPSWTDLSRFSEVFLSSSIREIAPVVEIDGGTIGAGRPGPVFQTLLTEFRRVANSRRGTENS